MKKRYDPTLTMRIPAAELAKLKALAKARGLTTAGFARTLLLDALAGNQQHYWSIVNTLLDDADLRTAFQLLLHARTEKQLARARTRVAKILRPCEWQELVAGGLRGAAATKARAGAKAFRQRLHDGVPNDRRPPRITINDPFRGRQDEFFTPRKR